MTCISLSLYVHERYLGRWLGSLDWLSDKGLGGIFVSPFIRTVQTAHFALEEMKSVTQSTESVKEETLKVEFGLSGADMLYCL